MDRLLRLLDERAARLSLPNDCTEDLRAVLKKYRYQVTPEDLRALDLCCTDGFRVPKAALVLGGVSGYLVGRIIQRRIVATSTGILLVYKAANLEPPGEQSLHRMLCLPTPMGAEMEAILRRRDANHRLLKLLPDMSGWLGRIAKPEFDEDLYFIPDNNVPAQSVAAGDDLWKLSDPFGIGFQQDTSISGPGAVKDKVKSSKAEE